MSLTYLRKYLREFSHLPPKLFQEYMKLVDKILYLLHHADLIFTQVLNLHAKYFDRTTLREFS